MIYREVLSGIPSDELLLAADRTFERAPALDKISRQEAKTSATAFNGLTRLGRYIQWQEMLTLKGFFDPSLTLAPGTHQRVGLIRQNLVLNEWFEQQFQEGTMDDEKFVTYSWLKYLPLNGLKAITKRYLAQEEAAIAGAGENDDYEEETPFPIEIDGALEEYPTLADFGDLLEVRLTESGVAEDTIHNILRGAQLGLVVVRESAELSEFHKILDPNYVLEP